MEFDSNPTAEMSEERGFDGILCHPVKPNRPSHIEYPRSPFYELRNFAHLQDLSTLKKTKNLAITV